MEFVVLMVIFGVVGSVIRLARSAAGEVKKDARGQDRRQSADSTLRPKSPNGRMHEGEPYGDLAYGLICPYCGNEADSFDQAFCVYCGHPLGADDEARITDAADEKSPLGSMHVVQPSFDGKHAHMETSMTGTPACPPEYDISEAADTTEAAESCAFDLRYAIIASEILGKPRATRRYKG